MKKTHRIFVISLSCVSLISMIFICGCTNSQPTASENDMEIDQSMPENKMLAGTRTVKNFLLTSLAPNGQVLWVTGGGWDYDDTSADNYATTTGLIKEWLEFFDSEDADYNCDETEPVDGKNVYHEKGLDCVGHVGWAIYNTLYSKDLGDEGFVYAPDQLVESLEEYCDFESADDLAGKTSEEIAKSLRPGDFAIMPGRHMYIVIGTCSDDSLLVVHSAMCTSVTGANGGGIQLSAISKGGTNDCEAYRLAQKYMSKYPEWTSRYNVVAKDIAIYTNFYNYKTEPESNGVFHWKNSALSDPEEYYNQSAEQIIKDLYE